MNNQVTLGGFSVEKKVKPSGCVLDDFESRHPEVVAKARKLSEEQCKKSI